jgi:ribose transport system substrate-binding protein
MSFWRNNPAHIWKDVSIVKRSSFLKNAGMAGAGAAVAGTGLSSLRPMAQAFAASEGRSLNSIRFSFIVKTINSDYWKWVIGAGQHAAKDLGLKGLAYTGGPSEAAIAAEVALVENAISQKPDFLVIAPTDKTGLVSVINKAYNAGIKVIIFDSNAPASGFNSYMATDNYVGGTKCADALAAAVKAKTGSASGQVAYATFISGGGSLQQRDQGFLDQLKKYPGLKVVSHKDAGGDTTTKPVSIATDVITQFPNLVGYFADNQQLFIGWLTAAKEKGVDSKKVSVVGFDSSPLLQAALGAGTIDGILCQNPWMMGYGGVCYGFLASIGVQIPANLDTGSVVATKANMNTPYIAGLLGTAGPKIGL